MDKQIVMNLRCGQSCYKITQIRAKIVARLSLCSPLGNNRSKSKIFYFYIEKSDRVSFGMAPFSSSLFLYRERV